MPMLISILNFSSGFSSVLIAGLESDEDREKAADERRGDGSEKGFFEFLPYGEGFRYFVGAGLTEHLVVIEVLFGEVIDLVTLIVTF